MQVGADRLGGVLRGVWRPVAPLQVAAVRRVVPVGIQPGERLQRQAPRPAVAQQPVAVGQHVDDVHLPERLPRGILHRAIALDLGIPAAFGMAEVPLQEVEALLVLAPEALPGRVVGGAPDGDGMHEEEAQVGDQSLGGVWLGGPSVGIEPDQIAPMLRIDDPRCRPEGKDLLLQVPGQGIGHRPRLEFRRQVRRGVRLGSDRV